MKPIKQTIRAAAISAALLSVFGVAQAAPEDKARVEIYGFIQLDAIYDFNLMDPSWAATLRPSKIPVNCPGDPGCGEDGETTFSVRQTRLGFNGFVPTELGELKTKLEFDFFGVGVDAGQTTIRLRHAYGELGEFLAGQTNSLFMDGDVFPNTIDYWGPTGMIFFRNVQVRWTFLKQGGTKAAVALEAPGSAIDAGQVNVIDPALGANVHSWNKFPDLTGQFRMDGNWGHLQAAGILRWLGYDTPNKSISGNQTGWGVNLSGAIHTVGKDSLLMQLAYGHGIANYFNDGGNDLAPNGTGGAEALPILGALVYYDHYWSNKWSSSIGYSLTSQDNSAGQTASAYKEGQYASVNLLHYPAKNVLVGGELLWGERENNNGNSATDNRIQFSAKYNF